MITVIDLGIGNVGSVSRALKHLSIPHKVSNLSSDINDAEKLILPGVGSFSEGMNRINDLGIHDVLLNRVLVQKIPILGICLGMQLFATEGDEGGRTEGLSIINAKVSYLRSGALGFRLPHIGWNEVIHRDFNLFDSIAEGACFYFVHSYEFLNTGEDSMKLAFSDYGVQFIAAVQKENIFGVQFHPEKSQLAGLKLLTTYCNG